MAQNIVFIYVSTPSRLRRTPPKFYYAKFRGRATYAFGNVAIPLFFAEKEGDENCECNFGGG